jgi:hypothetical protein
MADLLDILQNLKDTEAALAKVRAVAARHPERRMLTSTIASLQKRHRFLEQRFAAETDRQHLDVCTYRLIPERHDDYSIWALTSALGDFQDALALIYDAIKTGQRKERATWSADVAQETSLNFGYSFSGSLGFVFTVPNERLLLVDSILDMTFRTLFEMVKANSSDDLASYARGLGVAPIRKIYKWATDHVEAGLSAEIMWRRNDQVRAQLLVQQPELARLREVISQTSEETEERIDVRGVLLGGDLTTRAFRFDPESGEDIRGRLADTFQITEELRLGHEYRARFLKRVKKHYSTDKEDVTWLLIGLK